MTDLQHMAMAKVWKRSQAEVGLIFHQVENILENYPFVLVDIRYTGRSKKRGVSYEIWAHLRQMGDYKEEQTIALRERINTYLHQYLMSLKPYWEEINKAYKQEVNLITFGSKGIKCFLVGSIEPIVFSPNGENSEKNFPKNYQALQSELREKLGLLVVGQVIPILKKYLKKRHLSTELKSDDTRYRAVYAECDGNFERLIKELMKQEGIKS